jgi:hypothetical protein
VSDVHALALDPKAIALGALSTGTDGGVQQNGGAMSAPVPCTADDEAVSA